MSKPMSIERKAELFGGAMDYIFSHMTYDDKAEYEEVFEQVGFTTDEIKEKLKDIFEEDEE